MSAGDFPATGRLKGVFALIAALALIVGLAASSAQAGGGTATTAKKCKKKSRSASVAKKKCKKKKQPIVLPAAPALPAKPPAVTPPAPAPILRAELDWQGNADFDLQAIDVDGNADCFECDPLDIPDTGADGLAGDQTDAFEAIYDLDGAGDRKFTYMVCAFNVIANTNWQVHVVYSDGSTEDENGSVTNADSGLQAFYEEPGGYDHTMATCPT